MRWLVAVCALVPCALAGCRRIVSTGGPDAAPYVGVTIEKRPDVHATSTLVITWYTGDVALQDSIAAPFEQFPIMYDIESDGRTGPLQIAVDAFDDKGNLTAHGELTTEFDAGAVRLFLEGADFVVNSTYEGSQFLTNESDTAGLQLAAINDNRWAVVFRDDCELCDIRARMFDATGQPAAGYFSPVGQQFTLSTSKTRSATVPAVTAGLSASSPEGNAHTMLAVWDHVDADGTLRGVACIAFDGEGTFPSSSGQMFSGDPGADGVAATSIGTGIFAVTWQLAGAPQLIRSQIVRRDCTTFAGPLTVSSGADAHGVHVAGNSAFVLYAWIADGSVYVRGGDDIGTLLPTTVTVAMQRTNQRYDHVRVAPWGNGFAVAVRWVDPNIPGPGAGAIDIYRVSIAGAPLGGPYRVTDLARGSAISDHAFGIAAGRKGELFVGWHACAASDSGCRVYGQFVEPSGEVIEPVRVLSLAPDGEQTDPSVIAVGDVFVAAWTDGSMRAPDLAGSAVRARIIYPRQP